MDLRYFFWNADFVVEANVMNPVSNNSLFRQMESCFQTPSFLSPHFFGFGSCFLPSPEGPHLLHTPHGNFFNSPAVDGAPTNACFTSPGVAAVNYSSSDTANLPSWDFHEIREMRKPNVQNTSPNASRNPLWYSNGSTQDRGHQSNIISPNSTWGNLCSTAMSVKL